MGRSLDENRPIEDRLLLTKLTCGAALIRVVWDSPNPKFVSDVAEAVGESRDSPTRLTTAWQLYAMRAAIAPCVVYWCAGKGKWAAVSGLMSVAVSARTMALVRGSIPGRLSTRRHLHEVSSVIAVSDFLIAVGPSQEASALAQRTRGRALSGAQLMVAAVYTQAGIAKLKNGWSGWISQGSSPRNALAMSGTAFGRLLSKEDLSAAIARPVVLLELLSLPLVLVGDTGRRIVGLSNVSIHIGSNYAMRISYWHLAWLTSVLLLLPDCLVKRLASALSWIGGRH